MNLDDRERPVSKCVCFRSTSQKMSESGGLGRVRLGEWWVGLGWVSKTGPMAMSGPQHPSYTPLFGSPREPPRIFAYTFYCLSFTYIFLADCVRLSSLIIIIIIIIITTDFL